MKQTQSITTLPESPDDDRKRRMIQYGIAMTIRVACVIACFFVQGWWLFVPIVGAIVLPYIAVVFANVGPRADGQVERPGSIVLSSRPQRPQVDE